MRQATGDGEGIVCSAEMTVPPLSMPRRSSMWAAGQLEMLQRVRLRTLPSCRWLSRRRMATATAAMLPLDLAWGLGAVVS
jgi:hypothetical protein